MILFENEITENIMKRKFSLLLFFLVAIFTFSGCSCIGETILAFNNNFYGKEGSPNPNYTETLTYTVTYDDSNEYYQMEESVKTCDMTVSYDNGVFTQTLEVLSVFPADIDSDIKIKTEDKVIYKLTSLLTIDVTYTTSTETKTESDYVSHVVYFCNNDLSFAPIKSEMKSLNTFLFFRQEGSHVNTVYNEYWATYNQDSFTVNGKSIRTANDLSAEENTHYTENYTFRTILDNSQLLFVLRNYAVEKGSYPTIPVKNFNYKKATLLVFTNHNTLDAPVNVDYNGTQVQSLRLSEHEFAVNSTSASGMSQYYFLQNKVDNAPYNALMYRYVEPVIEYDGMRAIGSFDYNLVKVEISE